MQFRGHDNTIHTIAGQFSAESSGGNSEIEEVHLQRVDGRSKDLVAMKDIAHFFSQSKQFSQPVVLPPLWIVDSQIEQLQHSLKRVFEAFTIFLLERSGGTLKLASDIAELFKDGEGKPAAPSKLFVY
jgi:hypothetical protein